MYIIHDEKSGRRLSMALLAKTYFSCIAEEKNVTFLKMKARVRICLLLVILSPLVCSFSKRL